MSATNTTEKMNYNQYQKHAEQVVGSLDIIFAFSNEQLDQGLAKKGWKKEDLVCFAGGYCAKESLQENIQKLKGLNTKKQDLLQDLDFLYEALVYELQNHEFGYTGDLEQTFDALGLTLDNLTSEQIKVLNKAKSYVWSLDD